MKRCARCNQFMALAAFSKSAAVGRGGTYCKACQSEYCKVHYQRNRVIHNRRHRVNQARYRRRNRLKVTEYLEAHPCVDGGEKDTRVLEFDHVRGTKERNSSNLVGEGWAWQRIVSEIAKGEVGCGNCHRRRTVEQFGWPHAIGA